MKNATEIEVKFAVPDPRLFDLILADPHIVSLALGQQPKQQKLEALYYDTPSFALQRAGIAYRIRKEGEDWIATYKSDRSSNGGLYSREELNEKIDGVPIRHTLFAGTFAGEKMEKALSGETLELLFTMNFSRHSLLLQTPEGLVAELALDRGTIWSGTTGIPICELELELKQGRPSQLLELALRISKQWHLLTEPRSKYARGLELLQSGLSQTKPEDEKANAVARPGLISLVGSAVNSLSQIQLRTIEDGAKPTRVRELRIQCRRLRSALRFFEPLCPNGEFKNHIEKLRQWGALMGKIRDIDLLEQASCEFMQRFSSQLRLTMPWLEPLSERRNFLASDLLYRLQRADLTQVLLEVLISLLRDSEQDEAEPTLLSRKEPFIRKNLSQKIKKVKDESESALVLSSMKKLHRLRIRVKNLRYVMELLSETSFCSSESTMSSLKKLQSTIGRLHDSWQIKSLLDQVETGESTANIRLEQELFLAWRSRLAQDHMFALNKCLNQLPKEMKKELRTLSSWRGGRGNKSPHDSNSHKPS